MGIFNFLQYIVGSFIPKAVPKKKIHLTIEQKLKRIKDENADWERDFSKLGSFSNKASTFEKNGKLYEAIEFYLKAIEFGENCKKLHINNYAYDIERVLILYGKTKQKGLQIEFLQSMISKHSDYNDLMKWKVRLSGLLKDSSPKVVDINPDQIEMQKPGNPTLGKQYSDFKSELPEFNFYFDLTDGIDTINYQHNDRLVSSEHAKKLKEFRDMITERLNIARIAEHEQHYKSAIEIYEKLVAEEFEVKEPYERLLILYKKLKWKESEIRILKHAISFFTNLREKQRTNVVILAKKYGMETKALEDIQGDKKITYYFGLFDLYNPYPIIKIWESRLNKLNE